jgi:hypothetical protein
MRHTNRASLMFIIAIVNCTWDIDREPNDCAGRRPFRTGMESPCRRLLMRRGREGVRRSTLPQMHAAMYDAVQAIGEGL